MKRTLTGKVVSDKNDKTAVVSIETIKTHPIYRKKYKVSKKFMVHDEKNQAKVGDVVVIEESRPMSARKRWTIKSKDGAKK